MKYILVLLSIIFVAACGSDAQPPLPSSDDLPVAERTEDGFQTVDITADGRGFSPRAVRLQAGVPARLVFTRTIDAACLEHVSVPEFGIDQKPLPLHQGVELEFTPTTGGEYTFVCGMGMQKGTLVIST